MVTYCPYCGHKLAKPIKNGIASCCNCNRIFDSCHRNRLLSLSWLVRKNNVHSSEFLVYSGHNLEDVEFVIKHIYEECCSHEDFLKILDEKFSVDLAS